MLTARDGADAIDLIAAAAARRHAGLAGDTFEIIGGGRCRQYGRPSSAAATLDLSAVSGVLIYEPAELVLTARAGTPLHTIEALLQQHGQHMAFEPPDLSALWNGRIEGGTLGGCLLLGLGGPRRATAGAPRDHFLGFKAINGRGEAFAAGGRVVKNVTGFDLPKLFAGSMGTLGVLTEVTIKVMPRPQFTLTLAVEGLDEPSAIDVLTRAANSPAQTSAGAHLPHNIAALSKIAPLRDSRRAFTLMRLEGFAPAVEASLETLHGQLRGLRVETLRIESDDSQALWREVASVSAFTVDRSRPVWRLSVPPASACAIGAFIRAESHADLYYDAFGGVIWLQMPAEDPGAAVVRGALSAVCEAGAHATLVRASDAARGSTPPFQPLPPPLAALTRRVKRQFDPFGLFNPGRMYQED